jgi:hypothetical protein
MASPSFFIARKFNSKSGLKMMTKNVGDSDMILIIKDIIYRIVENGRSYQ